MKSARSSILIFCLMFSSWCFADLVDAINQASAMPQPLPKEVEKQKELEPEGDLSDFSLEFTGKIRPEMFYGKNMSELNDLNEDEVWYMRQTTDFNVHSQYGKKTYGCNVVESKFALRNRTIWGNPRNIAVTTEPIKIAADVTAAHKHFITRNIFWLREGWMEFDINNAFNLYSLNKHSFTLGIFSFELGRGIALGEAYATGPELLGFYSDALVDQFAPGMKLTGQIKDDWLSYDIYAAILENFASTTRDTQARVFTQQIGRLNPARGFGSVNYLAAGRLNITPVKNDKAEWTVEPYIMYNSDPEIDVEFTVDASSKLGTMGLASEFYGDRFEFGFDTAFNFGRQFVKPWDRNHVETTQLNGRLVQVNSHVYVGIDPTVHAKDPNLPLYRAVIATNPIQVQTPTLTGPFPVAPVPINNLDDKITKAGSQAASLIRNTPKNCCQNGAQIGVVPGYSDAVGGLPPANPATLKDTFFNAPDNVDFGRFRDGYTNKYQGFMFVADWLYWIYKNELSVAGTVGIATGDEDPNNEEIDGNYKGFVPLQEAYSGKRVQSAFVLGARKVKRPLSVPVPDQNSDAFAETIDTFTNLAFVGGAVEWKPKGWCKKFRFYPNVLLYWEPFPAKKFDLNLNRTINERSRSFLGAEFNTYIDYHMFENTKLFFVGALFVPGSHYYDIKGLPVTDAEAMFLDRLNDSNDPLPTKLPGLGTDVAWTFNLGLEYKF